jgi:hypothetical protein
MPQVGKRHFPYTPAGKKAAARYKSKVGPKITKPASIGGTPPLHPGAKNPKAVGGAQHKGRHLGWQKHPEKIHVKQGGVPAQLKTKFGLKDWRQKAYGGIQGYEKGLAQKINSGTIDPAKLASMKAAFAQVQARRQTLGVGKWAKQGGPGPTGVNPGKPIVGQPGKPKPRPFAPPHYK